MQEFLAFLANWFHPTIVAAHSDYFTTLETRLAALEAQIAELVAPKVGAQSSAPTPTQTAAPANDAGSSGTGV